MSEAPERLWLTNFHKSPCGAKLGHGVVSDLDHGPDYPEYVRADLLPVVKPLEWGDPDRIGNLYCNVPLGGQFEGYYLIEPNENGLVDVTFGVVCHEFDGDVIWRGPKEDAVDAANAHNAARIRANLDMIDPAALVAGAYEAAIRACINMGLLTEHPNDAGAVVLRALTPADAQAALDAAIAKAVNAKLDEVLKAVTLQSYADYVEGKPLAYVDGHSDACTLLYKNILAMKEPE